MRRWQRFSARALLCLPAGVALAAAMPKMGSAPTARAAELASCAVALTQRVSLTWAGGASIRLSRAQGVVGTALTLTGSHWPAGAAVMVDVYFTVRGVTYMALANLAQGTTAADGDLAIQRFRAPPLDSCVAPLGASGGPVVFLVHTLDGRAQAPVTFMYLTGLGPQIMISPGLMLAPGAQITMTGARWEPGERVTITPAIAPWTMTPSQVAPQLVASAATSVTTDRAGAFSVSLPALDEALRRRYPSPSRERDLGTAM